MGDRKIHEVVLRHNTRTGKDMKSKRVIVVDGKVRYAEKSKETHFIIKNGKDQLKLNIALSNSSQKGFAYQLFINDVSFTSLHNTYIERVDEIYDVVVVCDDLYCILKSRFLDNLYPKK